MPKIFTLQLSDSTGKADRLTLRFSGPEATLALGSDPGVELRLQNPGIEPRQCVFRLLDPETLCVEDASSASSTKLNGRPTSGVEMIGEGDWIEFADVLIEVVAESAANPYSSPPAAAPNVAQPTNVSEAKPESIPATDSGTHAKESVQPAPASSSTPLRAATAPPAPAPSASQSKPASGMGSRPGSKIPIPGGPVPKSSISRADTPRPAIPRIEIPRTRPISSVAARPVPPPPSGKSTPPPEIIAPHPVLPQRTEPVAKSPNHEGLNATQAKSESPAPPPISPPPPEPVASEPVLPAAPSQHEPSPANDARISESAPQVSSPGSDSSRPRQATLRPATRPPSNGPRLAPLSQPPRSMSPAAPAEPPQNPLVSRGMSQLRAELSQQTQSYTDEHLRAVVERGRSNANTLGFTAEDHVLSFLKCVILVGDELGSSDSKYPDVYFSLNLPGKPPQVRIERALKIAQRVNARGGIGLVPVPGFDNPDERPTSEIRVQPSQSPSGPAPGAPSFVRGVSEEILPSERRVPSVQVSRQAHRERDVTDPIAPSPSHTPQVQEPVAHDPNKLPEIEGFKVLEKIGSGGMGTVYRAYHHRLEVEVAIKVFKTLHPEAKTLLSREARAAARLQHPNIVQVLDYQEFGRGAYYAMQLVKGEDAHELVQRVAGRLVHDAEADGVVRALGLTSDQLSPEARSILQGKLPWHRLVAWWMAGVADGLDRAHREGIVHRDIKPSNLLLARDGRMTITDFGLALRRDDPTVGGNTARAGTPRYLSPERIADWASGSDLSGMDGRIDVWALGATMYELLTYRPAYDGAREAVMRDIVTLDPLPPSQVIWAVPQELDRICLQAMKRNPEERFQQAGEMASALRSWLMGEGPAAKPQNPSGGIAGWFKKGS